MKAFEQVLFIDWVIKEKGFLEFSYPNYKRKFNEPNISFIDYCEKIYRLQPKLN